MAEKSFDMEIGLGMAYDPSGAAAANADIDKLKQNAASVPQGGGSSAAPGPQGGGKVDTSGEELLAKARANTAEATGKATEASKELSAARTDGQKATTTAATVEKTLATERKATAEVTAAAADAETTAAAEITAEAADKDSKAKTKEQREIEALRAQMKLEALDRDGLIKELNNLGETFKVTGNYAAKDNRTQAQIHAADEKALRQRRKALERLKAAPDVDAATLKAINCLRVGGNASGWGAGYRVCGDEFCCWYYSGRGCDG